MIARSRYLVTGALVALVGCGAPKPPAELQNARSAFAAASQDQTSRLNPADLHVAERTLRRAEVSFEDDGASHQTKDLAYAAERQVRIAQARARTIAAERERAATLERIEAERAAALARARDSLSQTKEQLERTERARQAEEQGRVEAERRAKQAAADLAKIATVKQEPRGMVLTLSGSVLFATNKSELLPAARQRLSEVARTLTQQDKESKIIVEGHTDSQGSDELNENLSRKRADAVREFLVSYGIAADRVQAEGHGESRPVADNTSPEGRANNRRVEIVVQPQSGTSNTAVP
jgi:outer membrane protein OmpA-like peptidoglycan-associated protein